MARKGLGRVRGAVDRQPAQFHGSENRSQRAWSEPADQMTDNAGAQRRTENSTGRLRRAGGRLPFTGLLFGRGGELQEQSGLERIGFGGCHLPVQPGRLLFVIPAIDQYSLSSSPSSSSSRSSSSMSPSRYSISMSSESSSMVRTRNGSSSSRFSYHCPGTGS